VLSRNLIVLGTAAFGLCSCAHRTNPVANRAVPKAPAKSAVASTIDKQIVNAANIGDGDYQLRLLRARLDADPSSIPLRLELAERYKSLGFTEVAIEHCRLACERNPDSEEAHIALAKTLRQAERTREAATLLESFTSSHTGSTSAQIWAWLGLLRDDLEDWKSGEAAHRKALSLDPGRDEFHNNLGYCLLRQGRTDEAAGEFRAALQLAPHSTVAQNNLAMALASSASSSAANTQEAVQRMQSVADPATAHNNLAVALIEAGKYPEARKEIETALRYDRNNSAALGNLQLIANLEGRPAVLPSPAVPESRWAKFAGMWRRFFGSPVNTPSAKQDSGSPVASR
jgi:Flp pilus assembly protein TadD